MRASRIAGLLLLAVTCAIPHAGTVDSGQAPSIATEPSFTAMEEIETDGNPAEPAESGLKRMTGIAGRLHPALTHFPVAWIVLAAAFEWAALFSAWRLSGNRPARKTRRWQVLGKRFGMASWVLLALAALSSCVAAASGFLLSLGKEADALLILHSRLAYATLALAGLALGARLLSARGRSPAWRMASALLLSAAVLMVGYAGHVGGAMIFGEGYPWVGAEGP